MSEKDGGAAFARPFSDNGGDTHERYEWAQRGMSLRDYFAGQALQMILSEADKRDRMDWSKWCDRCATAAYGIADAMIAARETRS